MKSGTGEAPLYQTVDGKVSKEPERDSTTEKSSVVQEYPGPPV
jgi:hypothetical protein